MTRKRITTEQIEKAFELGVQSFDNNIRVSKIKSELVNDFDMNPSSAQGYIETVGELLTGHCYTRTINTQATEYYLSQIHQRYPLTSLKLATEAVRKHLDYYLTTKSSLQEPIRKIYEKYAVICEQEFNHDGFEDNVIIAKKDSSENRLLRLKSAPKQAKLIDVRAKLYRRNPDVVAETLYRAKGTCERCKQEAPFLRKKDNSPYLEVHHIKSLSDLGLDCIENTEALCPNCHREKHFG
jgi:5-methylcytosine-specific restriction protein A